MSRSAAGILAGTVVLVVLVPWATLQRASLVLNACIATGDRAGCALTRAIPAAEAAARWTPGSVADRVLARAHALAADPDAAARVLRAAGEWPPGRSTAVVMAEAYARAGDGRTSLPFVQFVPRACSSDWPDRVALDVIASADPEDAEQFLTGLATFCGQHPAGHRALVRLADLEERRGRYAAAIAWARRARQAAPTSEGALLQLARLLIQSGQPGEALRALDAAASQRPAMRAHRGWALVEIGRLDEGIAELDGARVAGATSAHLLVVLAGAYERVDRIAEAALTLREALALEPALPGAAERLRELETRR